MVRVIFTHYDSVVDLILLSSGNVLQGFFPSKKMLADFRAVAYLYADEDRSELTQTSPAPSAVEVERKPTSRESYKVSRRFVDLLSLETNLVESAVLKEQSMDAYADKRSNTTEECDTKHRTESVERNQKVSLKVTIMLRRQNRRLGNLAALHELLLSEKFSGFDVDTKWIGEPINRDRDLSLVYPCDLSADNSDIFGSSSSRDHGKGCGWVIMEHLTFTEQVRMYSLQHDFYYLFQTLVTLDYNPKQTQCLQTTIVTH